MLATVLILISLYFSFSSSRHEIEEVYDARLGQSAKMVLLSMSINADIDQLKRSQQLFDQWMQRLDLLALDGDDAVDIGHPYEQNLMFQFYRDGKLIWGSDDEVGELPHDPSYSGFGFVTLHDQQWRYFQLTFPKGYHSSAEYILVAEKQSIRDEIIDDIALSTALPQLVLIPFLAVLIILLIGKYFRPISDLQRAIEQRSANKLDKIYVKNPTMELSPLVNALNELLHQLDQTWQREKRFTRMAAHELKTPLTILRLNAENALLSENKQQLKTDVDNILRGIERTDRLIHQLLMLAKVGSVNTIKHLPLNLSQLLKNEIAELVPLALKKQQELGFSGDDIEIYGDQLLLQVLFSNLIDNAIRYSGNGSQIDVEVNDYKAYIDIKIQDNGSAIAPETREKIFDNFYRGNNVIGDGAGLGMSITHDIADLHNGNVELLPREQDCNTFLVRFKKS
jgi:two-component system sensor histidine kinase QseC